MNVVLDEHEELNALRDALRMMGLDPSKVAAFVASPGDDVSKAHLLGCITLDEARLVETGATNLDGWREWWGRLRLPDRRGAGFQLRSAQ